ncbi:MAG: hypothetical protein ACLPTM_10095 [Steroidobacteraceae bacterium]
MSGTPLRALLLAAPCVYMLCAEAAAPDANAALARLLSDPNEQQQVISGASRSTVLVQNPCPGAQYSIEKKFVPYNALSVDDAGNVLGGAWKQTVDEQGCGVSRVLNVMLVAQGAGKLAAVPLLPGATRADPVLQKDAVRYAVQVTAAAPGGREPDCTVGYVADTEYLGEEGETLPGAKGRPWKELWTLQSCTQRALVPMQFIPDATGTSISAGPNTAVRIVPLVPLAH